MFGLGKKSGGGMIMTALNMFGGAKMIESTVKGNADSFIDFLRDLAKEKVVLEEGEMHASVLLVHGKPNPADNVLNPEKDTIIAWVVTLNSSMQVVRRVMYYDLRNELMKADFEALMKKFTA